MITLAFRITVRASVPTGSKPMPASMFTVIRVSGRDGRSRPHYVSLPLVTVLLEERFLAITSRLEDAE